MADIPAISGVDDQANVRVVLLQGKQQVNAPLTALGFGTMANQNADSVNITGGAVKGITPLIVGHTAQLAIANTDNVQIIGTTVPSVGLGILSFVNGGQPHLDFYSSPSGVIGTYAPVVSGGGLGGINFYGAQQTGAAANWNRAAQIRARVGGTVTDGAGADMPGELILSTSPDGSGTVIDRMIIDKDGTVTITASGALVLPQAAAPAPTVEGDMRWDTDDNVLRVGNGATTTQVGIAMGAVQATTSGTTKTFSSIPAGTKRITVMIGGLSTNGTNNLTLTLGDAGGIETSGYLGGKAILSTSAVTGSSSTGAFIFGANTAAHVIHGTLTLTLLDPATFYWTCQGSVSSSASDATIVTSGSKALSQELNQIQISAGGDTFDAGAINIMCE